MKRGLFLFLILFLPAAGFAQPKESGFGDMNHALVLTPGAGLVFPQGDFNDRNDPGFSLGSGLEYFVSPRLALLVNYSFFSFADQAPPGLSAAGEEFHFLGLGARGFLFRDARLNPYLRAAGGLYQASGGSTAGLNAGPGVLYRISPNFGLFAEGTAHLIPSYDNSPSSSSASFLGVTAGLTFTLPTGKKSRTIGRRPGEPPLTVKAEEKRREPGSREENLFMPVLFEFDRYDLRKDSESALRKNLEVLQARPDLKIELEGHCDEIGTEEYNIGLGWKRADAVQQHLIKSGVDASRLSTVSYGKERPASLGQDPASRAKNRRVEFKIISR